MHDAGLQRARQPGFPQEARCRARWVSPDEPGAQKKFDDKYTLGFPLLSDTEHATATAYGVWGEKTNYGKTYMGIIRSSFLIDEAGKIAAAWYKVKPEDTVPKAEKALGRGLRQAGARCAPYADYSFSVFGNKKILNSSDKCNLYELS